MSSELRISTFIAAANKAPGFVSMAIGPRENTFKVDLSDFPKRPTYEVIHNFIHQTIGLQHQQVQRLQINHAQKCVHVKCKDLLTAEAVVKKHNGKHELDVDGCKFAVRLTLDGGYTEVKVHDLSESVTNEEIVNFLRHYGDVHEVKELLWGQNFAYNRIPSGVRVATMTLRTHIKSFVSISGEDSLITYRNQPLSCRHCTQPLHPGSTCVENKKLTKQAVAMSSAPNTQHAPQVDEEVIEQAEILD